MSAGARLEKRNKKRKRIDHLQNDKKRRQGLVFDPTGRYIKGCRNRNRKVRDNKGINIQGRKVSTPEQAKKGC